MMIRCSWPFTLLEKLAATNFPKSMKKESGSGFYTELLPQKKKRYLHDSISQLLPTQTAKEQVCGLLSSLSLVAPDTSQANNIPVQPWKCTSPSPPMRFVLSSRRQNSSTHAPDSYYSERRY